MAYDSFENEDVADDGERQEAEPRPKIALLVLPTLIVAALLAACVQLFLLGFDPVTPALHARAALAG